MFNSFGHCITFLNKKYQHKNSINATILNYLCMNTPSRYFVFVLFVEKTIVKDTDLQIGASGGQFSRCSNHTSHSGQNEKYEFILAE